MAHEKLTKLAAYGIAKNHPLIHHLNEIINQLIPTGITKHLIELGYWIYNRPVKVLVEDPRRILSLTDLEFGFVIWLASLSLPILCFLVEISIGFYKKIRKLIEELKILATARIVEITLEILIENYRGRW